jgi:UDP-N-acetyl-D-mannosaminuronate dehydrogenase
VEWSPEEVEDADCVALLTQHREFLDEPLWERMRLLVDARNVAPRRAPTVHRI